MSKTTIALSLLLSGVACGSGEGNGAPAPDRATASSTPSSGGAGGEGREKLSPAYLAGPWCYRYYETGGERSDEQIDYVFREDGTLLYQNTTGSAIDREGAWTLESGQLSIGPSIWVISKDVHRVEDARLVLGHERLQVVFERGTCATGAPA